MQHYVDNRLTTDVEIIEANSSDVLTDLGVLMHVMVKRRWRNPGKGWTDVPVSWLARSSRMGYRRVKESCDRLVALGILIPGKYNGQPHQSHSYKYELRAVKEEVYNKLVGEEEDWEEVVDPPKLESGDKTPYGTAYVFDNETFTMQPTKVTPDELLSFPHCKTCGTVFHPTEGRGRTDDECANCALLNELKSKFEPGGNSVVIKCPYGSKRFTQLEISRRLA